MLVTLGLLWVFGGLLALYTSKDLHAWLAYDEDATALEQQAGQATLGVGRATGAIALRDAIEARFAWWREPPTLLARQLPPTQPAPVPEAVSTRPEAQAPAAPTEPVADPPAPKRLLLVGASSINHHLGVELERCLEAYDDLEVKRVGKLGTGLGRPDAFDWPEEIAKLQRSFHPDLVLGQFGGNDCQPAVDPATGRRWLFGTAAWDVEYTRRVRSLSEQVRRDGADMGFLGQLAVKRPGNRRCSKRVDKATRQGAEQGGGWYLDTRGLTLNGPDSVIEELRRGGLTHPMWTSDAQHLTRQGAQLVAGQICTQLERRLSLAQPNGQLGRIYRFETPSKARGRKIPWYAVVPQQVPAEGVPTLYLLHGASGGVEDWMAAQDQLQTLSTELGLAFVLVDGDGWGWYVDGLPPNTGVETYLIDELIPEVSKRLPVNDRRGIAGLSMGGHGALVLALRHPGTFASASSMSGVVDLTYVQGGKGVSRVMGDFEEQPERWKNHSARHLVDRTPQAYAGLAVRFDCGTSDSFIHINRAYDKALTRKDIPHVYNEYPGGHDWGYWLARLPEHVRWHVEQLAPK